MRKIISLLTTMVPLVAAAPAIAQMYPGDDVVVNPAAIPPASGAGYPDILLKPPSAHRRHHHHAVAASTVSSDISSGPTESTPPSPPSHEAKNARSATPADTSNSMPFTFGEDGPMGSPSAKVATTEAPPAETRKPAKGDAVQSGLTKRGAILFVHDATDPQPAQLDGIRLLAGDLNSAIEAGAARIQLEAFGGSPGDKSSDARRISLKRALAIRQLLIDNGVPSNRIDVRAMGGITDNGNPDRVDIYIRAG
jgi:outer membrane protein OmpA-like peptidoglycan-associated protein